MLAIRGARVFPGGGKKVLAPALVLVDAGRIVDVDRTGAAPPPGAEVLDLGDVTLLPGLVDSHVHLCFDAGEDVLGPLQADADVTLHARMDANARATLVAGITTARDLGDRRYLGLALRDRCRAQMMVGPDLLVAGPPLTRTGGHCWFLGGEADDLEELVAAVAERARKGCDVVKVMATGGVITPGYGPHESQYGPLELATVVAEAHRVGLPVAAHAHSPRGIADSVDAGVDSVEHCTFLTGEGVEVDQGIVGRLAERGTFASFTLALAPEVPVPPPVRRFLDQLQPQIADMHRAGVRVVCSSDAGIAPAKPHGVLPHGAVMMASLGLTNAEALETVTSVAAQACGLGDRKGRLAPGYDADILAVDGDPLRDIRSLLDVAAVFRHGIHVR